MIGKLLIFVVILDVGLYWSDYMNVNSCDNIGMFKTVFHGDYECKKIEEGNE